MTAVLKIKVFLQPYILGTSKMGVTSWSHQPLWIWKSESSDTSNWYHSRYGFPFSTHTKINTKIQRSMSQCRYKHGRISKADTVKKAKFCNYRPKSSKYWTFTRVLAFKNESDNYNIQNTFQDHASKKVFKILILNFSGGNHPLTHWSSYTFNYKGVTTPGGKRAPRFVFSPFLFFFLKSKWPRKIPYKLLRWFRSLSL